MFFTRCADLYLKDGGITGMVMPHSALQAGQYSKWRSGRWQARRGGSGLTADFSFKTAWDLERLQPNTFFPVPASVVFARRGGAATPARPLAGTVERWEGSAGADDVAAGGRRHHRHGRCGRFALCRVFPPGGDYRASVLVLRP